MTATILQQPTIQSPIEELFSRDPLDLTEADIQEITEKMVVLCRAEIDAYNKEKATAAASGTKRSGTRTKKKQLNAQQQAAVAELTVGGNDFDPFA